MKEKLLLLAVLGLSAIHLFAEKSETLDLVKNGKSAYQIVIPDKTSDKVLDGFIIKAAKMLQSCVKESTGAELPVLNESKIDKSKPGIFIGKTKFAESHGIDFSKLKPWEHMIKVFGKNVAIAGKDKASPRKSKHYTAYMLGSVKGVIVFLERFAGSRFLIPGPNGIAAPKRSVISLPSDFSCDIAPRQLYNTGRSSNMFYDLAQNFYGADASGIKLFGGHLYNVAVPTKECFDKNPELFALLGNKRYSGSYNHLCISNPETRRRIYSKILEEVDKGYDAVELGQSDGYKHCECPECQKLLKGKNEPGEALWTFHKKLAEKLLKDRPGKKVMIISYGPTAEPPLSFSEFPPNVIIELCKYDSETLKKWAKVKVPGGFTSYVYNWGNYKPAGFTPVRTPEFCAKQTKKFEEHKIKGVYKCGFGELFGLSGPVYYIYGKLQGDSNLNPQAILSDFCKKAYGKAAAPMQNIFESLYEQLALYALAQQRNYKDLLPKDRRSLLSAIYSPSFLKRAKNNLERAKKLEPKGKINERIKLVEADFEYVSNLAKIIHIYNAYVVNPKKENFEQLAKLIKARNKLIASYYDPNGRMKKLPAWPDLKRFGNAPKSMLEVNGRLSAVINSPLTWDCDRLKKAGVLPGTTKKSIKIREVSEPVPMDGNFDEGVWGKLPWENIDGIQMQKVAYKTRFKLLYDKSNLYIAVAANLPEVKKFKPMGIDGPCWRDHCIEIFLDTLGSRRKNYHFIYNPVKESYYDAKSGYIEDPLDPGFGKDDPSWNGKWEYHNFLNKKSKTWNSIVKIPFKTLGLSAPPAHGSVWTMNIGRLQMISKDNSELSLWSPNLEAMSFGDREAFGELHW